MSTIEFSRLAAYTITVKGIITDDVFPMIDSSRIRIDHDRGLTQSNLSLNVKDQAELSSILNTLYSNRYVILKVEGMGSEGFLEGADQ